MKLIKPAEISAKIMTLIDEAEKELIIVSPYNNLDGWTKLTNKIKKAQSKGIEISWYSRKNNVDKSNSEEVRSIGIEPILVDDLHAKIYMNEEFAIFTSMNMSKVSDEKSIDFGYITENKTEYEELYNTFLKHIKSKTNRSKIIEKLETIPDKQKIPNEKFLKINSNEHYIKAIHEHIYRNYGAFEFIYKKYEILEYYDFKKSGYKIQFIPYSQAIKVHIYLPPSQPLKSIEETLIRDGDKLSQEEFEGYEDIDDNYLKYYFEVPYKKVIDWGNSTIDKFLKDFDILMGMVFPNT